MNFSKRFPHKRYIGSPRNSPTFPYPNNSRKPAYITKFNMKYPRRTAIIPLFLSICFVRCSWKVTNISRPNYPSWRHRKRLTPVTGLYLITIASPCTGRSMLYTRPARIINTIPSAPPITKCLLYTHAHARIGRHAVCPTRNLSLQE